MNMKMVCLDLDGTLLNHEKTITRRTRQALERAAEAGVLVVPATGRFFSGIPQAVRDLPFIRYAIVCNGAQLYDRREDRILRRWDIPLDRAMAVLDYMDTLPVIYDCFLDDWSYVSDGYLEVMDTYIPDPVICEALRKLRRPVGSLRRFLAERGEPVQKLQMFFRDRAVQDRVTAEMPGLFPDMAITSAMDNNLEINAGEATKGHGLKALCGLLGVDPEDTAAFGDGVNDLTMIRAAGLGVAMGNGVPALKAAADRVALTNEEDGVAVLLEELLAQAG